MVSPATKSTRPSVTRTRPPTRITRDQSSICCQLARVTTIQRPPPKAESTPVTIRPSEQSSWVDIVDNVDVRISLIQRVALYR